MGWSGTGLGKHEDGISFFSLFVSCFIFKSGIIAPLAPKMQITKQGIGAPTNKEYRQQKVAESMKICAPCGGPMIHEKNWIAHISGFFGNYFPPMWY